MPGFVSFFSGALGLDLGLEQAGLTPLAASEIDRDALQTIALNRPRLKLYPGDVRSLSVADFGRVEPFAVVGGPPCQAFSTAGKRQGLADERGNVFLHFLELAIGLRPRYIVIENVRGLLSAPLLHRPHAMRGEGHPPLAPDELPGGALRRIIGQLEEAGYGVSFELYNVANFGVPQSRERLLLIAASDGRIVPHLAPACLKRRTFRDAVRGLRETGPCAKFRNGRERFFKMVGPGENWRALPEHEQKNALGGAYSSSGGRVGFCRRLAWDRPSPTLVTSPVMPATELGHPEELRPLSVNEYRRLQTFPDDWQVAGAVTSQYRQLGNAVPVRFGEAVGRHLLAIESGCLKPTAKKKPLSRYRGTDHEAWRRRTA